MPGLLAAAFSCVDAGQGLEPLSATSASCQQAEGPSALLFLFDGFHKKIQMDM
jgi:hypothetical protein